MASLTILIPALNEKKEIDATARGLIQAARGNIEIFEIIMIDDGSTDGTGEIMDALSKEFPELKVVHNSKPMGLGYAFNKGLGMAQTEFITLLPGDNAYSVDCMPAIFRSIGKSDVILTYRNNQRQARKFFRFIISNIFNFVMTTIFGVRARDVHSMNVCRVAHAKLVKPIENTGFQVDLVITLLRGGASVVELPVSLNLTEYQNRSTTLKFGKFVELAKAVVKIFKHRPILNQ